MKNILPQYITFTQPIAVLDFVRPQHQKSHQNILSKKNGNNNDKKNFTKKNQKKRKKRKKPKKPSSRIISDIDSKFVLSLTSWIVVLQRQTGSMVNAIFTQHSRKVHVLQRHPRSPAADLPLVHIAANHELFHWTQQQYKIGVRWIRLYINGSLMDAKLDLCSI